MCCPLRVRTLHVYATDPGTYRKNKRQCHYCCSNFSKMIFACLGNAVVGKIGIEYKRFCAVNVMVKNIRKTRKITTRPTGVDSAASARPV